MKFVALIAFLLLPWAVVEGRRRAPFVSIGFTECAVAENETKQNNTSLDNKTNLTFCWTTKRISHFVALLFQTTG
jgi:hypothetical protein